MQRQGSRKKRKEKNDDVSHFLWKPWRECGGCEIKTNKSSIKGGATQPASCFFLLFSFPSEGNGGAEVREVCALSALEGGEGIEKAAARVRALFGVCVSRDSPRSPAGCYRREAPRRCARIASSEAPVRRKGFKKKPRRKRWREKKSLVRATSRGGEKNELTCSGFCFFRESREVEASTCVGDASSYGGTVRYVSRSVRTLWKRVFACCSTSMSPKLIGGKTWTRKNGKTKRRSARRRKKKKKRKVTKATRRS